MSLTRSSVVVFVLLLLALATAPAGLAHSLGGSNAELACGGSGAPLSSEEQCRSQVRPGRTVWEVSTLVATHLGGGFMQITGRGLMPGTVVTYTAQGGGYMESDTVFGSTVLLDGTVNALHEIGYYDGLTIYVATATTGWSTSITSDPIVVTDS